MISRYLKGDKNEENFTTNNIIIPYRHREQCLYARSPSKDVEYVSSAFHAGVRDAQVVGNFAYRAFILLIDRVPGRNELSVTGMYSWMASPKIAKG